MNAPKIPGWKPVSNEEVQAAVTAGELPYQQVNGQWYEMESGPANSLQKLVDEWIDGLWFKYHHGTATRNDGTVYGYVSDGVEAVRILKEFGLLDERGRVIEQDDERR